LFSAYNYSSLLAISGVNYGSIFAEVDHMENAIEKQIKINERL
jgi:hypothetical protein